jgi:hypothetical protein
VEQVSVGDRLTAGGTALLGLRPSLEGTWMLGCGLVASGALRADGPALLRVFALWLVADATLGFVLVQLVSLKRAATIQYPFRQVVAPPYVVIPYAALGSPGAALAARLNDQIARWRAQIWPHAGRAGVAALVAMGLVLVVATYLGREVLAAVSGALGLAAILSALAGRDDAALGRWLAGLHLSLAWVLGHLAFAPLHGPSLGLALLVGLNAYGRQSLSGSDRRATQRARWLLSAIWGILVLVLLMARQPILAAAVASAALAGRMTRSDVFAGKDRAQEATVGRLGWLLTMLLAALAVTYWVAP